MSKLRVVASGYIYAVTMMRMFTDTMREMDNIDLKIVGPFFGDWIPWGGGMNLPNRYVQIPDVPLPTNRNKLDPGVAEAQLGYKPDLWIQFDAGFHFTRRPKAEIMVTVGTDSHCLNDWYDEDRAYSDYFFNMQHVYMRGKDLYLPYAFNPKHHFPLPDEKKIHDGCLIGLHYSNRDDLVKSLKNNGYDVFYSLGESYEEFRRIYNQSKVALNWSSLDDLNARTFEAMGMKIPLLTNRVTDLPTFFVEGDHYLGFRDTREAVNKFEWLIDHPEGAEAMADRAYRKVIAGHTHLHRINQILETLKLL